jgi:hypothetical protein
MILRCTLNITFTRVFNSQIGHSHFCSSVSHLHCRYISPSLRVNCAGPSEFSLWNYCTVRQVLVQQQIESECLIVDFHMLHRSIIVINVYNIYSSMYNKWSTLIWYVLQLLVKVTVKMLMFHKTPHHEHILGSRTALHIPSLSMTQNLALTSHPSHTTPRERVPQPNG